MTHNAAPWHTLHCVAILMPTAPTNAELYTFSGQSKPKIIQGIQDWRHMLHLKCNTGKRDFDDVNEESIFFDVSDEDLERATAAGDEIVPTLIGTYCFTCPAN